MRAYLIEYGLLGGLAAVIAALLGLFGTWAFVTQVLEMESHVDWLVIVGVIVSAVVLTVAVGVATTWSALWVKPARFLVRNKGRAGAALRTCDQVGFGQDCAMRRRSPFGSASHLSETLSVQSITQVAATCTPVSSFGAAIPNQFLAVVVVVLRAAAIHRHGERLASSDGIAESARTEPRRRRARVAGALSECARRANQHARACNEA